MNIRIFCFFKWANSDIFSFIFILFKQKNYRKNCELQRVSNSDRWSRRYARRPLYPHHRPLPSFCLYKEVERERKTSDANKLIMQVRGFYSNLRLKDRRNFTDFISSFFSYPIFTSVKCWWLWNFVVNIYLDCIKGKQASQICHLKRPLFRLFKLIQKLMS